MILEGIVTTLSETGQVNIAPMGPHVSDEPGADPLRHFVLKPFQSAQTYRNLKAHGEGVLHVTDDVLLLVQAAVGHPEPMPPLFPAAHVRGQVLKDACRYAEFARLAVPVEKTGGPRERQAFAFLCAHLERVKQLRAGASAG